MLQRSLKAAYYVVSINCLFGFFPKEMGSSREPGKFEFFERADWKTDGQIDGLTCDKKRKKKKKKWGKFFFMLTIMAGWRGARNFGGGHLNIEVPSCISIRGCVRPSVRSLVRPPEEWAEFEQLQEQELWYLKDDSETSAGAERQNASDVWLVFASYQCFRPFFGIFRHLLRSKSTLLPLRDHVSICSLSIIHSAFFLLFFIPRPERKSVQSYNEKFWIS